MDASGEQSLLQILQTEDPEPDELVLERDCVELISESMISCLDGREAGVIRDYFGLDGEERQTLGEIGVGLGVTRERVRQIRNRALTKLRRFFKQRVSAEESWKDLV